MWIEARPAGIACGTVKVAISFFSSSATRAVWLRPPASIVTAPNSISAAFNVMVVVGR